ncbi:MAG TPA: DUF2252 domain-containing protein [Nocardioidaceae bacterium]
MSAEDPAARTRTGHEARTRVPPEAHAELSTADRPSPVRVLGDQASSRVPELVPIRHTRMTASPFAFYRGAAAVMAGDLAGTPVSGLDVRLCGDAHLANFGMFASPERALLFDINDFDETYPGPWEWDLKRLAASLVVAGRGNGFSGKQTRRVVVAAVRRYRDAMASFAELGNLAVWYSRVDVEQARRLLGDQLDPRIRKRLDKSVAKARGRDHLRALNKLTEVVDGRRRIVADPPLVVPVSQLAADRRRDEVESTVEAILLEYAASLGPGHRELVGSYTFVDMARKVVGVGSVGTRCWIVLLRGRDDDDPLFLQVKEAQESVLARHLGPSPHGTEGERVVAGQRIMQAASDVFLGWHRTKGLDGKTRDLYVRQLHDWKGSATIETMTPKDLRLYAELCAWTLARAHARSGDRIAVAAYLGDDDSLPQALADFAHSYADLNEQDYATFSAAVASGELAGTVGGT